MKLNNKTVHRARVLSLVEEAPRVFVLRFTREFEFKAGQMLWLRYPDDGPARLYSLSSGEKDTFFEIIFDVVDNGALTPGLSRLKAGEEVWISKPLGKFTSEEEPAVWIATGTSIAPFASMARSGYLQPVLLIQGGKFCYSFYYQTIFKQMPNLEYVRCITREACEGCFQGRVTQYLETQYQPLPLRQHLLCGSAEMVVEVRDLLIALGIPFQNIISEIYF